MKPLSLDTSLLLNYIQPSEMDGYRNQVEVIHQHLKRKEGVAARFLGWHDYPFKDHVEMVQSIEQIATEIRLRADILVVIGVGGSFLGARAVQTALTPYFGLHENGIEVVYCGQNMSGAYLSQLLRYLEDKRVYINVISKSGSTMEPALAFRVLRNYMQERYGFESKQRIIVTTDAAKGILKELADEEGYRTFVINDDIGGRYSVLTPVGLLPIAVAGNDIAAILAGARAAAEDLQDGKLEKNNAYQYAVIRQLLHQKGYEIEMLASFEPGLSYFHEWWKQLFGESEGKEQKGIFPAAVSFSTDLHSVGQYIQDGQRILFETLVHFNKITDDLTIPFDPSDCDGLNFLIDKTFNNINCISKDGTALAHTEGGVPVIKIELEKLDEFHIGYLIYFFMTACAMSAYLFGVNPFDQPGVEAYKNKMLSLLNKQKVEESY
ncbi:glucose-6-phosphate isomerase [Sporosarcina luteola]|nr:glucose-6-phosphate isomerase [Sporosarcina luteola]